MVSLSSDQATAGSGQSTDAQADVIAFLSASSTHGGAPVERIDTHISIVFLAGPRAWKLKRAVRFDYIDASMAELRRRLCEAEVLINRRTAGTLYQGVVPITRDRNGSLALGGAGTPIDWVVEMQRFDQRALFDNLARHHALGPDQMVALAEVVASFHLAARPRPDHGGASAMQWVIDGNASGLAEFGANVVGASALARYDRAIHDELDRDRPELDERRHAGYVRECHGDLHLRNIVAIASRPVLFDAIEFNERISCIDTLYDVAFLVMDLWHRQLPRHANALWNHYLDGIADREGLSLMPLFLSCRAAVRAKSAATAARMRADAAEAGQLQRDARGYFAAAVRLLRPPPACLVAIGGRSGAGKSTLAREIAPFVGGTPGAVVLLSDAIRKDICGVPRRSRLGPDAYTQEVNGRVYRTLLDRAAIVARQRSAVIADATFLSQSSRRLVEQKAREAGVPFVGLWLDAGVTTMMDRLAAREQDVSDADAAVLRSQLNQPTGHIDWRRIDGSPPLEIVVQNTLASLGPHLNDANGRGTRRRH